MLSFIKNSGNQFKHDVDLKEKEDYRIKDIAQRLKPKLYYQGDVLKKYGEDSYNIFFICQGTVSVYDY